MRPVTDVGRSVHQSGPPSPPGGLNAIKIKEFYYMAKDGWPVREKGRAVCGVGDHNINKFRKFIRYLLGSNCMICGGHGPEW